MERNSDGYIVGSKENFREYNIMRKTFHRDTEKHIIDLKDIRTFPKPNIEVKRFIEEPQITCKREIVVRLFIDGTKWIWEIIKDDTRESGMHYVEVVDDGDEWWYR